MSHDILVVDDEADIRDLVSGILMDEGYATRTAANADEALEAISARVPSLVVLDIWLKGSRLDGLELLDQLQQMHESLPVIIISGHGTIDTAVAAIHKGAYDFVEKPFQADRLLVVVSRAIESARLKREVQELVARAGPVSDLIGESTALSNLRSTIKKIAPTNSRILITGAAGSGKEVVARQIHAQSSRGEGPFVVINAATISPDRMEQELFGVEPGPGRSAKVGVFEQAHGGTLYLDEVAEMPTETQSRILRVLVDQKFTRVGGAKSVQVDVRVVSSSSRNLRALIDEGRFREDLYHRLNVVPLHVPGLKERRDDIPLLVEYFMHKLSGGGGLAPRKLGDDALAILQGQDWPGNVRQLRNIVERLMILSTDDVGAVINADQVPGDNGNGAPQRRAFRDDMLALPLREAREVFERDYLQAQIERFGGNISRTAAFVGMERSALHRKLKMLGLGPEDVRGNAGNGAAEPATEPEAEAANG